MLGRFSYETSLLARFEILGLFVNTLSSHERYSGHNRENFPKPIQMQLSKNLKTFSEFFIRFLKSTQNLENSEKKNDNPHSFKIFETIDSERRGHLIVEKVLFQNTLWK